MWTNEWSLFDGKIKIKAHLLTDWLLSTHVHFKAGHRRRCGAEIEARGCEKVRRVNLRSKTFHLTAETWTLAGGQVRQPCGRRHRRNIHFLWTRTWSPLHPGPLHTGSDPPPPSLWNDSPSSLGLFCFCACCLCRHESLLDFQPAGLVEEVSLFGPLVLTLLKRALVRRKLLWEDDEKGGKWEGVKFYANNSHRI